jgi:hypothetical protein
MKRNIEQLYNTLKKDKVTFSTDVKDANSFEKKYFSSEKDANNLWEWLHKTKFQNGPGKNEVVYFPKDKKRFYEVYACDLTWAKNLRICGGGQTPAGNLPSWVPNCIKNDSTYKNVKPGRVNTEVVYDGTNGREYFLESDNKYRFRKKDGSKVDGTYECVDNKLYINTVLGDGQIYWEGEWKTLIKDKDLLEKINASSSFAQIVKIKFINLLDVSKAWTFKKIKELNEWWKNYKKNRDNDTTDTDDNTESNGIYTTKGDPYQYKIVDCVWYTKSLIRKRRVKYIPDWISLEDNGKANRILDGRFPNARKECKKTDDNQNDGGQTIITPPKPTPPPVVLPTWAKCIGDSIVGVNVTKDENNLDIVFSLFGKSKGYFWNDGAFMYVYENGNKVAGKWSCDNNKLLIRTEDGDQWTPSTQWITQPSKYINPSVHNSTTDVNINDLVDDESTPTQTTKSDKQDSTNQFKAVDLPKDIGVIPSKPDISDEKSDLIDKYGPKNESYNTLEDVLNNINSFINEIEMKEIIREQKQEQSVVNAPAEELDILYGNAILKTKGPVVTLCESGPTPIPVNVEGRMYFAGRQTKLKPGYSAAEGYIVYDGRILIRTQGCNFVYLKKGNDIPEISGMERKGLELPFKQLLSRFGVDNMDYNSNPYYFIDTITNRFNSWIDKGARSSIFRSWQELLINYYKYDNTKRLKLTTDNQNNPPQDELTKYIPLTADKLGVQFNERQIQIFVPKNAALTNQFTATKFNEGDCRQDLVSYINGAYDFQQTGTDNPNVNNSAVRTKIKNCFRAGMYKNVRLNQNDITVQFNDKDNPFMGLRGCGSDFSLNNIQKALMGNGCKLEISGANGKNKYLPFRIDATKGMTESTSKITNLIKENLTKIKREKDSSLLIETKIIKSRTQLLSENRILKFKQPREKFFNEIISEALYLNKQGFDKQIIKEEFWDSLKGLFGEHGSNAIFTTFKEYMGKYLVGKLTSINPNGWMGENIKEAINKIHIEDLDKITDCNFISRKISTSITDSIISKVSKGQDIEGGNISSIVKGGLDKSIDRTELTKNIHEGITKLICPVLGDVSKKLKEKGEEMKLKAVRP